MKGKYEGKKVYHYTVGRSGSTLISQIIRDLFGRENVIAGHEVVYQKLEHPVIITYRDFRDVMVSYWRTARNLPLQSLDKGVKMKEGEVKHFTNSIRGQVANDLMTVKNSNPHALLLKYEDFYNDNFKYIFDKLENYFEFEIPQEKKDELAHKFSFIENKKRSDGMKNWADVESETMIHGKHLYKGKIGCWKDLIPKHLHNFVNSNFEPFLKQWGYKI